MKYVVWNQKDVDVDNLRLNSESLKNIFWESVLFISNKKLLWCTKVSFFFQCTKMQLVTSKNLTFKFDLANFFGFQLKMLI